MPAYMYHMWAGVHEAEKKVLDVPEMELQPVCWELNFMIDAGGPSLLWAVPSLGMCSKQASRPRERSQ